MTLKMNLTVLKFFRSIQVYFPFLQDLRFVFRRNIRRLLNKTHEEDFEILQWLPANGHNLYVDIGANRGEAVQSMLMRRPETHIVAFEPNSLLTKKLVKLYGKDPRVQIQNCGLGDQISKFDLYIPFYNNYMFDGLASFKEENARNWLKNRLYGFTSKKLEIKKVSCTVKRLDDFALKPSFIKIDVQGFEYEVLLGAERTLNESQPILLVESPGKKEIDFLRHKKYKPFMYKNRKLIPGTKHSNIFFIPEKDIEQISTKMLVVK
jgi:FkbM family methyltransferase